MHDLKSRIIEDYNKTFSISEVLKTLKKDNVLYICKNGSKRNIGRDYVKNVLQEFNIYEGLLGNNYRNSHGKRLKKVFFEKYSVENPGQLSSHKGFKNKLPYERPKSLLLLDEYRNEVTKKTKNKVASKKFRNYPKYCEYTGILFSDAYTSEVNPNCYRKRSIDHKYSTLWCFMNNISVEDCCANNNLSFILKYANTMKNNMTLIQFQPFIPLIRKIFKDEGIECKEIN